MSHLSRLGLVLGLGLAGKVRVINAGRFWPGLVDMNRRLCRLDDVAVGNVNHYPRQQLTHLRLLPPHTHAHTHAAGRMTFAHLDSRPPRHRGIYRRGVGRAISHIFK